MHVKIYGSSCELSAIFAPILNKIGMCPILVKLSRFKFYYNLFGSSQIVTCKWADGHT
jgi:hypothetical protein